MSNLKIDYTSELMTDYVSLQPHPGSRDIAGALDENLQPMCFSIGLKNTNDAGKLKLTRRTTKTSGNLLIDLSERFKISAEITHLAVTQDSDLTTFLAFATDAGNGDSRLHLCKGLKPHEWDNVSQTHLVTGPVNQKPRNIARIFLPKPIPAPPPPLGVPALPREYPLLAISGENAVKNVTDFSWVTVNHQGHNVSWDYTAGGNPVPSSTPKLVLDVALGMPMPATTALYILYTDGNDNLVLDANILAPDGQSFTPLQAPANAKTLGTIARADGTHDLLVGCGAGLHYFSSESIKVGPPQGKLLAGIDLSPIAINNRKEVHLRSLETMTLSQDKLSTSVWFRNKAGVIGYAIVTLPAADAVQKTPFLTYSVPVQDIKTQTLAPMFAMDRKIHHFLYLDDKGNHTLLSQGQQTNIWQERPWLVPGDVGTSTPLQTYTMDVAIYDKTSKQPYGHKKVSLLCHESMDVTINGKHYHLGTNVQQIVTTSKDGSLHLMIPVADAANSSVISIYTEDLSLIDHVDPAHRVKDRMSTITDSQSMKNLKFQTGGTLDSRLPSNTDWDWASNSINQLHQLDMPADGSTSKSHIAAMGFLDDLAEVWHWIEHKFEEGVAKLVQFANEAWKFVVKIAEETYEFILDSAKKVMKAVMWVWKKIKVAVNLLIDLFGLLFDWSKILERQRFISGMATGFLDQMTSWSKQGEQEIVKFLDLGFDSVENILKALKKPNSTISKLIRGKTKDLDFGSLKTTTSNDANSKTVSEKDKSSLGTSYSNHLLGRIASGDDDTSGNFVAMMTTADDNEILTRTIPHSKVARKSYCFRSKNESSQDMVAFVLSTTSGTDDDNFLISVGKELGSFLTKVEKNYEAFVKQLSLDREASTSTADPPDDLHSIVLDAVIDFVIMVLDDIKELLKTIFNVLQKVVEYLAKSMTDPIEIPLISALYRLVFSTDPPSLIDVISFICAIPLHFGLSILEEVFDYKLPDVAKFKTMLSETKVPDLTDRGLAKDIKAISSWLAKDNTVHAFTVAGHMSDIQDSIEVADPALAELDEDSSANTEAIVADASPVRAMTTTEIPEGWRTYSNLGPLHAFILAPRLYIERNILFNFFASSIGILQRVNLALGVTASAFTFPNLGTDGQRSKITYALWLEVIAWIYANLKAIIFLIAPPGPPTSDKLSLGIRGVFSSGAFILKLIGLALRASDIDDRNAVQVERTINGLMWGELFGSALGEGFAVAAAWTKEDPEVALPLAGASYVFTATQILLDTGRAIAFRYGRPVYRDSGYL